jgi:hypothetical protein
LFAAAAFLTADRRNALPASLERETARKRCVDKVLAQTELGTETDGGNY